MNIGIICEFNPFHKGHKYLIDSVKNEGDAIICAMSGNFVQRGEPAVFDKYERARTAVENGADLVIEIPTVCSTLSAQGFARAGVRILEGTGICDSIAFGAECDDLELLKRTAAEIKEKDSLINEELKKGISYPSARQNVIDSPVLEEPNNLLAIEYLSCTILNPVVIKRIGKGHDSNDGEYSASEIRKTLDENETASLKHCEKAVLYKLRTMTAEDFTKIRDVSEGLENRILNAAKSAKSLDELYGMIKTKRYTHSRIRRIVLRAFLSITSDEPTQPQYLHILAFSDKGRELLPLIKKSATLPLITKYGDAQAQGGEILSLYKKEIQYTNIYNLCFKTPRACE